jgi:hypothetical protein
MVHQIKIPVKALQWLSHLQDIHKLTFRKPKLLSYSFIDLELMRLSLCPVVSLLLHFPYLALLAHDIHHLHHFITS